MNDERSDTVRKELSYEHRNVHNRKINYKKIKLDFLISKSSVKTE
jgi:hypothetical protein